MIIGTRQIALSMKEIDSDDIVVFASGVSDLSCKESTEFKREKKLLLNALKEYQGLKFIYFSSCALSAPNYKKNSYYRHKLDMENLTKENTDEVK